MVNIGWLMYPVKLLFPLTRKLDSVNEYVWDCLLCTFCNVLKMNDIMVNHLYSPIFSPLSSAGGCCQPGVLAIRRKIFVATINHIQGQRAIRRPFGCQWASASMLNSQVSCHASHPKKRAEEYISRNSSVSIPWHESFICRSVGKPIDIDNSKLLFRLPERFS